ncbi:uncharacterized protein LOC123307476 [Coccinella septempunctata]|uniref:uncharacterized protein LOC123307476 n=1 Tax=Coccinella septempunctata TaxID=41139 RepID=UPI001D05F005|nr:uncharacterized protein LOC123307476 [Coccinella septempunctata]
MNENVENSDTVHARKSLYMRIAPVVDTYDDVIKNKLQSGKFPFTRPGVIKVVAMLCLIASLGLFLGTSLCDETSKWYPFFLPSVETCAIATLSVLYVIFASGCTTNHPAFWVKLDITLNLFLAVVGIVSIVTSMCDCGKGDFSQVIIGVVGICGYLTSVIGCISIFLMYRFVDDKPRSQPDRPTQFRKSVFA